MYETNRREATEEVLNQVAAAMRSAPSSGFGGCDVNLRSPSADVPR